MALKTLDPRITQKLLEGHKDILTPLVTEREQFYKNQICPQCTGDALTKVGDSRIMFKADELLPKYLLKCNNCDCLFDPHLGLQLTMGNLANALKPTIPILEGPED